MNDDDDKIPEQLTKWIEAGEGRAVLVCYRATDKAKRGAFVDPILVMATANGEKNISAEGPNVRLCARAVLDQLRTRETW